MNEYRYYDDVELEKLIAQVESKEMLSAPVYLKDEILNQISVNTELVSELVSEQAKPVEDSPGKWKNIVAHRQFIIYSLKIVAAAAAALFILVTVPVGTGYEAPNNFRQRQLEREAESYIKDKNEVIRQENADRNQITNFVSKGLSQLSGQFNNVSDWLK